jgi:DNA modification methylase
MIEAGGKMSEAMQAFRTFLGDSDMMAYLAMMAPRLVELRRVLKATGSIYLHCDPTASHYLKILMDAVLGPQYFRNEIIWKRTTAHSSAKKFGPVHDVLLYFSRSDEVVWNAPRIGNEPEYLDKYYKYDDGDGRLYWRNSLTAAGTRKGSSGLPWRGIDVAATGQHWKFTQGHLDELDAAGKIYWPPGGGFPQIKRYREELKGVALGDIWTDIDRINQVAAERLGYPTQKPEALLERIIAASSNQGDTVLDPFCGCGTTIAAAQKLGRRWVGIDVTNLAISLIRHRLADTFGAAAEYEVIGEPVSRPDAAQLAHDDPSQFQWWALGLVGARPAEGKKGADRGIDGRIYFHEGDAAKTKQIVLSVKAGHVTVSHLRDLLGVLDREKAQIGVLLCMDEPTTSMRKECASAGFYTSPWGKHARLQMLTVEDLLTGKTIDRPPAQTSVTFKRAPKAQTEVRETSPMPFGEPEDVN